MGVRWAPAAASDLQHISDYLKENRPYYRQPTMRKRYEDIRSLRALPNRGRPGREERVSRVQAQHRRACHFAGVCIWTDCSIKMPKIKKPAPPKNSGPPD